MKKEKFSLPFVVILLAVVFAAVVLHSTEHAAATTLTVVDPMTKEVVVVNPYAELENALGSSINTLRANYGLAALTTNDASLRAIADVRATEISTYWSHIRPNGQKGSNMISPKVWRGENLAYAISAGQSQSEVAAGMMANWMNSPSHLDNILFAEYKKMSLSTYAVVNSDGTVTYYVACMFAGE